MVSSRIAILSRKSSFLRSNDFILPLPKREFTPLASAMAASVATVGQAGCYRSGGVGVFGEKGLVHLAPASERVPIFMKGLFEWLRNSKDHLLIRSYVFHYEFEFIHPFIDGNGRIGRLWQSLILGKLHPLFEYLPNYV